MTKLIRSSWMVVLAGFISFALTMALLSRSFLVAATARARKPVPVTSDASPSWKFHNPELENLIQEVVAERENLKVQRVQLKQWQDRLEAERLNINMITQQVHQFQADLEGSLVRVRDEERDNLKRLAKVYAGMSPSGAVQILIEKDDEAVVKILAWMKDGEISPILEAMAKQPSEAKRAAAISERLRLLMLKQTADAKSRTQKPN